MFSTFPKYRYKKKQNVMIPTIKHSDLIKFVLADGKYKSIEQITRELSLLIAWEKRNGAIIFPIDSAGLLMQLSMLRKKGILEKYGNLVRLRQ
ncbi:MAG: hypothetical protein ACFFC7_01900 [Candidatus Hermodarchaeota archaeon]